MTLKELSAEYYEERDKLTRQINALREKSKEYTGAKKHTANRQLCCLYEMRRDVSATADLLEHYYDNKAQARIYHRRQREV